MYGSFVVVCCNGNNKEHCSNKVICGNHTSLSSPLFSQVHGGGLPGTRTESGAGSKDNAHTHTHTHTRHQAMSVLGPTHALAQPPCARPRAACIYSLCSLHSIPRSSLLAHTAYTLAPPLCVQSLRIRIRRSKSLSRSAPRRRTWRRTTCCLKGTRKTSSPRRTPSTSRKPSR